MRTAAPLRRFAIPAGVFAIALVGAVGFGARSRTSVAVVEIPQPAGWVAFESKVEISKPGHPKVLGRFARASDGSTRLETGPATDTILVVSIHNVSRATMYVRNPKGAWSARPMDVPETGYRPPRMRTTATGLSPYPQKVALLAGQDGSLRSAVGLDAYHYVNPSGNTVLMIPALNFFPVLREDLDGRRELYYDIKMGEPASDIFEPDPGAAVTMKDKPGGIVQQPLENALHRLMNHDAPQ